MRNTERDEINFIDPTPQQQVNKALHFIQKINLEEPSLLWSPQGGEESREGLWAGRRGVQRGALGGEESREGLWAGRRGVQVQRGSLGRVERSPATERVSGQGGEESSYREGLWVERSPERVSGQGGEESSYREGLWAGRRGVQLQRGSLGRVERSPERVSGQGGEESSYREGLWAGRRGVQLQRGSLGRVERSPERVSGQGGEESTYREGLWAGWRGVQRGSLGREERSPERGSGWRGVQVQRGSLGREERSPGTERVSGQGGEESSYREGLWAGWGGYRVITLILALWTLSPAVISLRPPETLRSPQVSRPLPGPGPGPGLPQTLVSRGPSDLLWSPSDPPSGLSWTLSPAVISLRPPLWSLMDPLTFCNLPQTPPLVSHGPSHLL
ncbi:putative protein YjzC [Dissostichus eleginoides]|uniref:Uncharacterized protein n=1 Tax=Dissostichus eleginoides TaxID=100907 RepID=A0AAD9FLF6_DISEL|nr:putative protein YjzC [Dissostichus eleginoides]